MNPGSKEAISLGCSCPKKDNNYGTASPWPPDGWWISEHCVIHRQDKVFLGKYSK